MSEWIATWWERLLFELVGWTQCKARYRPYGAQESLLAMYCVRCKWHLGPHRDNNGEWQP